MPSPKSQRQQPPLNYKRYTLIKEVGSQSSGILGIPYSRFTRVIGPEAIESETNGLLPWPITFFYEDANRSETYRNWNVSTNGTVIISDGATDTLTSINSWSAPDLANSSGGSGIFVLAPWLGYMQTCYASVNYYVRSDSTTWAPLNNPRKSGVWYLETQLPGGSAVIWRFYLTNICEDLGYIFEFDCILYSNGRIEFRYAPVVPTSSDSYDASFNAAIGTWGPKPSGFRDFQVEQTQNRTIYEYGGAVYTASYTDPVTGTSYYSSGRAATWPGGVRGARYVFEPPRILDPRGPRLKSIQRSNRIITSRDKRSGTSLYSDNSTVVFNTSNISMPLGIPRYQGGGSATTLRFVERGTLAGALSITASISPVAINDYYSSVDARDTIDPWNEDRIFEPGSTKYSDFKSGSVYDTLDLRTLYSEKECIDISFPVSLTTKFPVTSSALYFYSPLSASWMPYDLGSVNQNTLAGNTGGTPLVRNDWVGFNPFGYAVVSGSEATGTTTQNLASIFNGSKDNLSYLSDIAPYNKMIGNVISQAPIEYSFPVNIEAPFIFEGMEVSVPIAAGNDWFRDMTSTTGVGTIVASNIMPEFGGPAFTYSIWRKKRSGIELITSGTITHIDDALLTKKEFGRRATASDYYFEMKGFSLYAGKPSGYVTPLTGSSGYYFTGSAVGLSKVTQTSGFIIGATHQYVAGDKTQLSSFFASQTVSPFRVPAISFAPYYISVITPYNKDGSTFTPLSRQLGASCFGYGTKLDNVSKVKNPYYDTVTSARITNNLGSVYITLQGPLVFNLTTTVEAPYLLQPGDQLLFAISKTHPVLSGTTGATKGSTYNISGSGSTGHDFQLISGSLGIKMFGSYVREGKAY